MICMASIWNLSHGAQRPSGNWPTAVVCFYRPVPPCVPPICPPTRRICFACQFSVPSVSRLPQELVCNERPPPRLIKEEKERGISVNTFVQDVLALFYTGSSVALSNMLPCCVLLFTLLVCLPVDCMFSYLQ
jgi:hypothetical protein